MIIDPLKIVLFPGGCGGNFIADWLTLNESTMRDPKFQIDGKSSKESPIDGIDPGTGWWFDPRFKLGMIRNTSLFTDNEAQAVKDKIFKIAYRNTDVVLTHIVDSVGLSRLISQPAHYITIWPITNKFGWMKTIYHKNNVYDTAYHDNSINQFEHLLNYITMYDTEFEALDTYQGEVFDYGLLQDIDSLIDLYQRSNGRLPSDQKIDWAKRYIAQQFKPINPTVVGNLIDLIRETNTKDLFDLAILVYVYEKSNPGLKRIWSVDDVPDDPNLAFDFFTRNHMRYC